MQKLIDDIKDYIAYLESEFKFQISICDPNEKLFPAIAEIYPNNIHRNHYCTFLKQNHKIQKKCVLKQAQIRENENMFFYGVCYNGVGEYVHKIVNGGVYLGFISVGSYRQDNEKYLARVAKTIDKYALNASHVNKLYHLSTTNTIPESNIVKSVITPLVKMFELLYLSITKDKKKRISNKDELFHRTLLYINENFTNQITIEKICETLHYSKSYLSHLFMEKRNITIMHYVTELRIAKSKEFLINTNFPIYDIALSVGLNNTNYFTNVFKKATGMSPSKYRNLHQDERVTIDAE